MISSMLKSAVVVNHLRNQPDRTCHRPARSSPAPSGCNLYPGQPMPLTLGARPQLRNLCCQSASCSLVRISTKKHASSPRLSASSSAVCFRITPCSRIRRMRFHTGVFELPTLRAISSKDCSASYCNSARIFRSNSSNWAAIRQTPCFAEIHSIPPQYRNILPYPQGVLAKTGENSYIGRVFTAALPADLAGCRDPLPPRRN